MCCVSGEQAVVKTSWSSFRKRSRSTWWYKRTRAKEKNMFPDADFTVVWEIPLESQLEDSYLYYFVSQKCQKKGANHLFTDTVGSCTALTAVEKGRPEKGSLKSCVNGVNREGMSKRRAVIPL